MFHVKELTLATKLESFQVPKPGLIVSEMLIIGGPLTVVTTTVTNAYNQIRIGAKPLVNKKVYTKCMGLIVSHFFKFINC